MPLITAAKVKHEVKAVALATLFFGAWIGALVLIKTLVLAEYEIGFSGWSKVLAGALILGKVALILEHVPLGARVRSAPAWVDVLLRTLLYSCGVFIVLVVEHGLSERHEHGGFTSAVAGAFHQAKLPHMLATTLCLSGALLAYNGLALIRRHLGPGGLLKLFTAPPPPPHT